MKKRMEKLSRYFEFDFENLAYCEEYLLGDIKDRYSASYFEFGFNTISGEIRIGKVGDENFLYECIGNGLIDFLASEFRKVKDFDGYIANMIV